MEDIFTDIGNWISNNKNFTIATSAYLIMVFVLIYLFVRRCRKLRQENIRLAQNMVIVRNMLNPSYYPSLFQYLDNHLNDILITQENIVARAA
jgi:hypothetical protein